MSATPIPSLQPRLSHGGDRLQTICRWFVQPQIILRFVLYLTTLLYLRTLPFDYVYDDTLLLLFNPGMQSWKCVPGFFTHTFWGYLEIPRVIDFYRPLVKVALATVYRLLGPAPGWFHLLAAGMHILATYLVYRLVSTTTENKTLAAIAAGIFSLHPTKVETAAWISGISDSLSAVFFLSSMIAYFESKKGNPVSRRCISAGFLLLALFSKEAAVFACVLIGIYEFSVAQGGFADRFKATVRAVWPFAAVTCFALTARIVLLRSSPQRAVTRIPFSETVLTAPQAILSYLGKQLWPVGLSVQYPLMAIKHFSIVGFVAPLLAILAIFGLVIWRVRKSPIGIFYVSWFALMLAPAIIYQITLQEHDRYFYFASVATSIGLAFLILQISRWGSIPLALTIVFLFASMAVLTFNYESYWDNDVKLFTRAHRIAPDNPEVEEYLVFVYIDEREFANAEALAGSLTNNTERSAQGWRLLADVKLAEDKSEEARFAMQKAVQLTHGRNLLANVGLVTVDLKLGNNQEAVSICEQELKTHPDVASLHGSLAAALTRLGKTDEAARELELQKRFSQD